ncbi:MAG: spore cortex biosynthesis protein YabQ [Oscillospiraceae bacterium]|nr:spore cortex biosynthesis protein YabQ [Oscillospiraceae bacterium]
MELYVADQTLAFLGAIAVGAALGLVYDVFRITRIAFPIPKAVIFFQDVLYFLICAAVTFLYLMSAIHGKIRIFLLAGELIGWVLYHFTIGQLVMRISAAIIEGIRRTLAFLFRYIAMPIWRLIYRIVYLILIPPRFLVKIAKKNAVKVKFYLKVRRLMMYNQLIDYLSKKTAEEKDDR